MSTSLQRLAALDRKADELAARNPARRDTRARSRAAFGIAAAMSDLVKGSAPSRYFIAGTEKKAAELSLALLADSSMTPTLAVVGSLAAELGYDFELLFIPQATIDAVSDVAMADIHWPGVVAISSAGAPPRQEDGAVPAMHRSARYAAALSREIFSNAAAREFHGDLANYPVWRFILVADEAHGKLQIRFNPRVKTSVRRESDAMLTADHRGQLWALFH